MACYFLDDVILLDVILAENGAVSVSRGGNELAISSVDDFGVEVAGIGIGHVSGRAHASEVISSAGRKNQGQTLHLRRSQYRSSRQYFGSLQPLLLHS